MFDRKYSLSLFRYVQMFIYIKITEYFRKLGKKSSSYTLFVNKGQIKMLEAEKRSIMVRFIAFAEIFRPQNMVQKVLKIIGLQSRLLENILTQCFLANQFLEKKNNEFLLFRHRFFAITCPSGFRSPFLRSLFIPHKIPMPWRRPFLTSHVATPAYPCYSCHIFKGLPGCRGLVLDH